MVFAVAVGIMAGIGAIVFQVAREFVEYWAMDWWVGYRPDAPAGEMQIWHTNSITAFEPWWLLVIPAVGGLAVGCLGYYAMWTESIHGTNATIHAYHHNRGRILARVPFLRLIMSVLTLGTGGSGGQEGPIAQIGAGFGSLLATKLKLSDGERRTLMAAGLGAGIGALFHAPLAGAIFATEVLYRDPDFEAENLIPAFFATAVAYNVYSMVYGFKPLFEVQVMQFDNPYLLIPLTAMAVMMALASLGYVKCYEKTHRLFIRLKVPRLFKPAIGGLLTGALGVGTYYAMFQFGSEAQRDSLSVISVGYGFLQKVIAPQESSLLISVLLVVGLGKMLTSSITIGSGGSAGVFGPCMVIGGTLGAVVGLLFQQMMPTISEWMGIRVDVFAILGMASFFAVTANTPVSTLIMVSEMTGSYTLLLPAMWVCALAYLIGRKWTIFGKQVGSRLDSPAHREDFVVDVLQGMSVRDAIDRATRRFQAFQVDRPFNEIVQIIGDLQQTCFPILDKKGQYFGLFSVNEIRQVIHDSELSFDEIVAEDLVSTNQRPLTLEMDLSIAINQFASSRYEELPVVDAKEPDQIIALLRRQDLIAAYSAGLMMMKQGGTQAGFGI